MTTATVSQDTTPLEDAGQAIEAVVDDVGDAIEDVGEFFDL